MLGIDLVQNSRFANVVAKYRKYFLKKIFTDAELARYSLDKKGSIRDLTRMFAVKEAVIKALGKKVRWHDIVVDKKTFTASVRGEEKLSISASSSRDFTVAVATTSRDGHR